VPVWPSRGEGRGHESGRWFGYVHAAFLAYHAGQLLVTPLLCRGCREVPGLRSGLIGPPAALVAPGKALLAGDSSSGLRAPRDQLVEGKEGKQYDRP